MVPDLPDEPAPSEPAPPFPIWHLDVPAESGQPPPAPAPAEETRPSARESVTPPPLVRIVEAILFVGGPPLTAERAAEVIRALTPSQFAEAVEQLNRQYRAEGRPYLVLKQEGGYTLTLRPIYRFVTERLYGGVREARLSQPAVEVLAVVAYRQPVSRKDIDTIRGHDSSALLRQLVRRGLICVLNRAESGGHEVQYGTTPRFLELFGLSSLNDLPETEDLRRL